MNGKNLTTASLLTYLILFFTILASAGGLLFRNTYRDNSFVVTTWLGNDIVTLLIAVPILVTSLVLAKRGSIRGQLVWVGALDYLLYNYAFYLFGSAFNAFFLLYVILLGLNIFALIFLLANLDVNAIARQVGKNTPVRWIGGYFLFVAAGLGLIYFSQCIAFIITGQLPAIIAKSGHITNVVFALDLTLLVPWLVLGGIWLMKRQPWGNVIAGALSVKGPLYTIVLTVNTLLVMRSSPGDQAELPIWVTLTVLGTIASTVFYKNILPTQPGKE